MQKYKFPEYPQSGLKAMSVEREKGERKKERAKVSVNNGQYKRLDQCFKFSEHKQLIQHGQDKQCVDLQV